MSKKNIAIFFGGMSSEHSISCMSACSAIRNIDLSKYNIFPVVISTEGNWFYIDDINFLEKKFSSISRAVEAVDEKEIGKKLAILTTKELLENGFEEVAIIKGSPGKGIIIPVNSNSQLKKNEIDVAFPILHGTFGEDGRIQGLLEMYSIPIAGCGLPGSFLSIDKAICKTLCESVGIKTAPYVLFRKNKDNSEAEKNLMDLKLPLFIKPAKEGSSIGMTMVNSYEDVQSALDFAFKYDEKVLVEEKIVGREIECSVLGYDDPIFSNVGEVIYNSDSFYDNDKKYINTDNVILKAPTEVEPEVLKKIHEIVKKVFIVLELKGMSRVDIFLREDNTIFLNEVNSTPGLTEISMYTKLLESTGVSYKEVLSRVIDGVIDYNKKH